MTREVHQLFRNVAGSVVEYLRESIKNPQTIMSQNATEALEEIRLTCLCQPGYLEYVLLADQLVEFTGTPFATRRLTIIRVAPPGLNLVRGLLVNLWSYQYKGKWRALSVLCEPQLGAILTFPELVSAVPLFTIPVGAEDSAPTLEESIKAVSVDVDEMIRSYQTGPSLNERKNNLSELQDSLRSLTQSLLREMKKSIT